MHIYNCLRFEGQLQVIDFDDCCMGSYFYDMAAPLTYLDDRKDYEALKVAFYQGYLNTRPLPMEFEDFVKIFMVTRAFDILEWIHFYWPDQEEFPGIKKIFISAISRINDILARRMPDSGDAAITTLS